LGHNDIVEVLLQHGANANAGTLSAGPPEAHGGDDVLAKDVTALHMAASKGDAKLVKLLIKFGANINASTMALDRHTGSGVFFLVSRN
jgi:ankyrin repeat protein